MRSIGLPEFHILGTAVLWFGAASVFARTGTWLGRFSYRWGLFMATVTGLHTVLLIAGCALSFRRISALEMSAGLVWASTGVIASLGLVRRSRLGVIAGFVFYAQMLLWPAVFNPLHGVSEGQQATRWQPILVLVATNIVYFMKRWKLMSWN